MIAQSINAATLRADELIQSDIIQYVTGDTWIVTIELQYIASGISSEVLGVIAVFEEAIAFAPECVALLTS